MAVLVEGISVLVRADAIEARFPGGMAGFVACVPNQTFCADGQLVRVGFMAPRDVQDYVAQLEARGLIYLDGEQPVDMVVADQLHGFAVPCSWAELAKVHFDEGKTLVAASKVDPENKGFALAVPPGWTYEESLSHKHTYVEPDRVEERMELVDDSDSLKVFRDKQTGKLAYAGTTSPPEADEEYRRINKVASRALELDVKAQQARAAQDQESALVIFEELTLELLPTIEKITLHAKHHCGFAHFAFGLVRRILDQREEAIDQFQQSLEYNPGVLNTLLEMTRCLGELNRAAEAEPYAKRALKLEPESAAAWGNFAMTLIQLSRREEAWQAINQAIEFDPADAVNNYIADNFDAYFK